MKGTRKILVALDNSLHLVSEGIRLAGEEKSWLTVLKVLPPYEGELHLTGIKNIRDLIDGERERIDREVKAVARSERAMVKTRIEPGEIDRKIVEVAREENCDLIVMGRQKTGFWQRLTGRNIVEKVIGRADCPVYVVGA